MDFAQAGPITTLPLLHPAHTPRLESELEEFARDRPITLVLPCHASELDRPAPLQHLCAELAGARWLREVIVAMNGLNAAGYRAARAFFTRSLHLPTRVLWSEEPRVSRLVSTFAPGVIPDGKALNVWLAFGVICAEERSEILVTHDCDVRSFRRKTLARLCHACAHPELDFGFAKLFYARVTDRLYGRVSRLLLAPLLRAIRTLGVADDLLDFLLAFRYPLAGECAIRTDVALQLPTHGGWGLEIGMLCEVFRRVAARRVCQVESGDSYDHRHHPATGGVLSKMAEQVAATLLSCVGWEDGMRCADGSRMNLHEAFQAEVREALRRSAAIALANGLRFDEVGERALAEDFSRRIEPLLHHAGSPPAQTKPSPSWAEIFGVDERRVHFLEAITASESS